MKEEDLIKRLENVKLPDIKPQGHQRRLRMALLDTGYRKRQRQNAIWELVKSKVKGVKDAMIKGLISRQPVWKIATVGVCAVALVLGLSLAIPFTPESVYAQAEEIVQNSPEIRAAIGEVTEVKVINIVDGTVIAQGKAGTVTATLDLEVKKVTDLAFFTVDEQVAIDIAKADPRVQELLDLGAVIGKVSTLYVSGAVGNVATGEMEGFTETFMMVEIEDSENIYVAHVNLTEGKLVRLTETPLDAIPVAPPSAAGESFFIPDSGAQDSASGEEGR